MCVCDRERDFVLAIPRASYDHCSLALLINRLQWESQMASTTSPPPTTSVLVGASSSSTSVLLSNELDLNELLCDPNSPQSPHSLFPHASYTIKRDWLCLPSPLAANSCLNPGLNDAKRDWLSSSSSSSSSQIAANPDSNPGLGPSSTDRWLGSSSSQLASNPSTYAALGSSSTDHWQRSSSQLPSNPGSKPGLVFSSTDRHGLFILQGNDPPYRCNKTKPNHEGGHDQQQRDHQYDFLGPSHTRDSLRGSYSAALRLSDVAAALRKSSSVPTSSNGTINPLTATTNPLSFSTNPKPIPPSNDDLLTKTLQNVDYLLQRARGSANLSNHKAGSKRANARKGKKSSRLGGVINNKGISDTFLQGLKKLEQIKQAYSSTEEPAACKRDVHIYSERQRRKGMTHLYTTLHSLLPEGKTKTDRCSVLTETMKYIRSLLTKLEELGLQKSDVIASTRKAQQKHIQINKSSTTLALAKDLVESEEGFQSNHDHELEGNGAEISSTDTIVEAVKAEIISKDTISDTIMESVNGEVDSKDAMKETANAADEPVKLELDCNCGSGGDKTSDFIDDGGDYPSTEVGVRFFGGDAFITLRTLKRRGLWSGVLEILHNHDIEIINVTLSTSPESDFHCIHAKVPRGCEIRSCELHRVLKAFLVGQLRANQPAAREGQGRLPVQRSQSF